MTTIEVDVVCTPDRSQGVVVATGEHQDGDAALEGVVGGIIGGGNGADARGEAAQDRQAKIECQQVARQWLIGTRGIQRREA